MRYYLDLLACCTRSKHTILIIASIIYSEVQVLKATSFLVHALEGRNSLALVFVKSGTNHSAVLQLDVGF